jgi:hypothetical protein
VPATEYRTSPGHWWCELDPEGGQLAEEAAPVWIGPIQYRRRSSMHSSDPDERARLLADEARPLLGADGFSDERIDELAFAFVNDHVGEDPAEFVMWARAEGPIGLDPEAGF